MREGSARLDVVDDGRGFDVGPPGEHAAGYGLRRMTVRAELVGGSLVVRSRRDSGTTVIVVSG